jgi:acyl-coenzyme A synthetase/AMP-(fatty) acid ligase
MLRVTEGRVAAARRNAYFPALITDSRVITYGDLATLIARVSNYLVDRGTEPRTRIFINVADPDLRVVLMLAAMHAGMVPFVLLEQGDKEDLGPHVVVGSGAPHVAGLAADVMIDQGVLTGSAGDPVLRVFPDRGPDEILLIGATTGTTGIRKLVAELRATQDIAPPSFKFAPDQRAMLTLGDTTMPNVIHVRRLLAEGATHVRYPRETDRCIRLINFTSVSHIFTTPVTVSKLVDAMEAAGARCPTVRHIMISGSLFQKRLVERIERNFDAKIFVGYGSAEVRGISTGPVTSHTFEVGYVGQLMPGITLAVAGSKDSPAPVTIINRASWFPRYFANGKLQPVPSGPMTLPDLGYMQGDSLYLLGRSDEVFNASGNKTAFSIIEHALLTLPGVTEIGMIGAGAIGDPTGLIVAVAGSNLDPAAFRACVVKTAKAHGTESSIHIVRVSAVPRNAMGKVDRDGVIRAYRAAHPLH